MKIPSPSMWREARAIIFDFNGTLSDDEHHLELAYREAFDSLGLAPVSAHEYGALLGLSDPDITRELLRARDLDVTGDLLDKVLDAVSEKYATLAAENPTIAPEAVTLVRELSRRGVPLGIATGTLRRMIEPVLSAHGILDAFSVLVTIEDVAEGKPSPEGFLRALETMEIPHDGASDVVILEDSRAGIRAAQVAGARAVGIGPHHGHDTGYASMNDAAASALEALASS